MVRSGVGKLNESGVINVDAYEKTRMAAMLRRVKQGADMFSRGGIPVGIVI